MNTHKLYLCVAVILIASCGPAALPTPITPPTSTPGVIVSTTESIPSPTERSSMFVEPDPETYVRVLPAVLEYFYYRKKAMVAGNVEDLWAHYPELKNGVDAPKGINAESFFISNYQALKLFDGNISPEEYERFKVNGETDEIQVLVHGMELYLFLDEKGQYSESGGEFKIVLYLRIQDDGWEVFKTDEVMQDEWQQFNP
jgi:hypothetical protein